MVFEDSEVTVNYVFRTGDYWAVWRRWGLDAHARSLEGAKLMVWALMQHYSIRDERSRHLDRAPKEV